MKTFHEKIRLFLSLREFSDQYRLCWHPQIDMYTICEFFDEELNLIDPKKIEILIK